MIKVVGNMSRRKYYVHYWKDFNNTYELYYSDKEIDRDGFEKITRKEAIRLCVEEKERRRTDPSFSGYASTTIMPYEYDYDPNGNARNDGKNIAYDKNYCLNGYIWELK